ncbi:MAG: response regulator [bacterium]|nr:response regulator [bacterium]MCP5071011.1 response regulator [bacterium]
MSQTRVLVVDDERFFREAIREALEPEGFDLVLVGDGASALEEATDESLGVVILDLQLPDLHGLEVFRRLRELRSDLRVIILSAHTDQEYVLEALRLGACDYLAKPLHDEELRLAVVRAAETFDLASSRERLRSQVDRLDQAIADLWQAGIDEIPARVALATAEVLRADRASLLLVDASGSELDVAAAVGVKQDAELMPPIAFGQGVAGLLALEGESACVSEISADSRFGELAQPERYATGAFAIAPVLQGGQLLGLLCVADPTAAPAFDPDDVKVLGILAGQVAVRLAASDQAGEDAAGGVDARSTDLARRICEALTAEVEPTRTLEAVLRPVGELLGAAPVSVFLTAPDGKALRLEAQWDGGQASDRTHLEGAQGLTGSVLEGGRLVASPDPAADPRFDVGTDTPEDAVVRPLLCGPLRFRDKTLGVFRVFPERADDASAELGELLSACLSAAVRNVLLYRSLLETIEEVAIARREGQAGASGSI